MKMSCSFKYVLYGEYSQHAATAARLVLSTLILQDLRTLSALHLNHERCTKIQMRADIERAVSVVLI